MGMEFMSGPTETGMKESGDIASDMVREMTSLQMETHTWASITLEKQMVMANTSGQMVTSTPVFSLKV